MKCSGCNKKIKEGDTLINVNVTLVTLQISHRPRDRCVFRKKSDALENKFLSFHPKCFTKYTTNNRRLKNWGRNLIVDLTLSEL